MKPIYLEPDEEITSIIERLSKIDEKNIAVVVPKNSTMFQSLVNIKLLARQAKKLGKTVTLISSNKIGSRLAKQVGIDTYATLGTVATTPSSAPIVEGPKPEVVSPAGVDTLPDGTPVHRYSPDVINPEITPDDPEKDPIEPVGDDTPEPEFKDEPIEKVASSESNREHSEPPALAPIISDGPVAHSSPPLPPIISSGIRTHREFVFPWKSALVAGSLVALAILATVFFLPKGTITLTFPAQLISESLELSVSTTPSDDANIIAGNLLTSEKTLTQEVVATGQKDIGTKASGTLAVRNCEDTNTHSLPAGTKATGGGKTFSTSSTVTIPAGSFSGGGTVCNSTSVSVGVIATEVGDSYNLSSTTFTFAGLASRISGTGSTSGGVTKKITVLSQDDANKAYAALSTQLLADATNDLKSKAGTQSILESAIKQTIVEQKIDKEVGAEVEKATASVTLNLYTITFDEAALRTVVENKLKGKLTENQELIVPEDKKAAPIFKAMSDDKNSLTLTVEASGYAAPIINKKAVAKEVNNKSLASAESFLKEKYRADEVKIEIIPGWWLKRLPILSQAISVEYGFHEEQPTAE